LIGIVVSNNEQVNERKRGKVLDIGILYSSSVISQKGPAKRKNISTREGRRPGKNHG